MELYICEVNDPYDNFDQDDDDDNNDAVDIHNGVVDGDKIHEDFLLPTFIVKITDKSNKSLQPRLLVTHTNPIMVKMKMMMILKIQSLDLMMMMMIKIMVLLMVIKIMMIMMMVITNIQMGLG